MPLRLQLRNAQGGSALTLKNGVERRPKVQACVFAHQGEHEFASSELLESMAAIGVPANLRDLKKLKRICEGYYAHASQEILGVRPTPPPPS